MMIILIVYVILSIVGLAMILNPEEYYHLNDSDEV